MLIKLYGDDFYTFGGHCAVCKQGITIKRKSKSQSQQPIQKESNPAANMQMTPLITIRMAGTRFNKTSGRNCSQFLLLILPPSGRADHWGQEAKMHQNDRNNLGILSMIS